MSDIDYDNEQPSTEERADMFSKNADAYNGPWRSETEEAHARFFGNADIGAGAEKTSSEARSASGKKYNI